MPAALPSQPGSSPLANARHEAFAQKLAAGEPLTSWAATADADQHSSPESAKASGWRVARRSDFRERVSWLRGQRRPQAQKIDRDPVAIMREVALVLRDTASAFDHLPLQKRSALKNVYSKHLSRLHKMEEQPAQAAKPEGGILQCFRACQCLT